MDRFVRNNPDANKQPMEIEDLVQLSRNDGPCPYYLSRSMAETADLVFMPYNYIIDAKTRLGMQMICWDNAVIIFDEAHNIEVNLLAARPAATIRSSKGQ